MHFPLPKAFIALLVLDLVVAFGGAVWLIPSLANPYSTPLDVSVGIYLIAAGLGGLLALLPLLAIIQAIRTHAEVTIAAAKAQARR